MEETARFLKALADEARLKILWLLSRRGELCVCDLTGALGITQSKTSRHLATLRQAGLVACRREGAWAHYSVAALADGPRRELLAALAAGLAGRSGAQRVLDDYDAWLARGERARACAARGGCGVDCQSKGGSR